jgi:hypothetical protein
MDKTNVPPTKKELSPLATPLNPPSVDELRRMITDRIVALFEGANGEHLEDAESILNEYQADLRECIGRCHPVYKRVNMLEILDEQIIRWREEESNKRQVVTQPFSLRQFRADIDRFYYGRFEQSIKDKYNVMPDEFTTKGEALHALRKYQLYPYDECLDLDLIERAMRSFPGVDLLKQINKKIIWWNEHPSALQASKSPRIQLWDWFKKEDEYQQHKRDGQGPQQF